MALIDRELACQKMTALYEEDCKSYGVSIPECFDSRRAIEALKELPSEEQVIRCRDCRHWYLDADTGMACEFTNMSQPDDGFCNWAERRTDEAD